MLRLVVYPITYRILYIPGGCLGILPSTVCLLSYVHFQRQTLRDDFASQAAAVAAAAAAAAPPAAAGGAPTAGGAAKLLENVVLLMGRLIQPN